MRSGTSLNKEKIVRAFSRSALSYDEHSRVQKRIAAELLAIIASQKISPKKILDVGTGTGEMAFLLHEEFLDANITGCDVAPGMIESARKKTKNPALSFDLADCESLPYPDKTFDLVASSSTFQWVEDLESAFSEIRRVSLEGATFAFATFSKGTLAELKTAYAHSFEDPSEYFHHYRSTSEIEEALSGAGFVGIRSFSKRFREIYSDAKQLLRSIKRVGAANAAKALPSGLRGRAKMEELVRYYEKNFGSGHDVYATYEVDYFTAKPYDDR